MIARWHWALDPGVSHDRALVAGARAGGHADVRAPARGQRSQANQANEPNEPDETRPPLSHMVATEKRRPCGSVTKDSEVRAHSQPAGSMAAIQSLISWMPAGLSTREGSSGILTIGSSDSIRNTTMLWSGSPGTMS